MTLLIAVVLLALLGWSAFRFGVDTRDGRDWQPYALPEPRPAPPAGGPETTGGSPAGGRPLVRPVVPSLRLPAQPAGDCLARLG